MSNPGEFTTLSTFILSEGVLKISMEYALVFIVLLMLNISAVLICVYNVDLVPDTIQ